MRRVVAIALAWALGAVPPAPRPVGAEGTLEGTVVLPLAAPAPPPKPRYPLAASFFGQVPDGHGGEHAWDHDIWRIDTAVGWRFDRHLQAKLEYAFSRQTGPLQQGEQLVAAQLTLRF